MKIILIAAMDPNGVIGRTSKACDASCEGSGSLGFFDCAACKGTGRIPCNELPWGRSYPEDLAYFKAQTMGHAVVMGRRTWESIGSKPLPGRPNIVISSAMASHSTTGAWVFDSLSLAIDRLHDGTDDPCSTMNLYIIGGARLFAEALPIADELRLTLIGKAYEGDVRFPEAESFVDDQWTYRRGSAIARIACGRDFECVSREPCPTNANLTFTTWCRRD